MSVTRVASVIRLRADKEAEYRALHENVWPGVLATLRENGITNYSIYLRDGTLFSYLEYRGDDYAKAMARIAADESTQEWWKMTDPCQEAVDSATESEWWAPAEELFHLE
jgi:L-rhamnose mutarotase